MSHKFRITLLEQTLNSLPRPLSPLFGLRVVTCMLASLPSLFGGLAGCRRSRRGAVPPLYMSFFSDHITSRKLLIAAGLPLANTIKRSPAVTSTGEPNKMCSPAVTEGLGDPNGANYHWRTVHVVRQWYAMYRWRTCCLVRQRLAPLGR